MGISSSFDFVVASSGVFETFFLNMLEPTPFSRFSSASAALTASKGTCPWQAAMVDAISASTCCESTRPST